MEHTSYELTGEKMDSNTTYAVVDIETTGTNLNANERVIQISCVFVKKHKIINTFVTDINPEMSIPNAIQQLTGITNQRVRKAPLFDDIAPTLFGLLSNTVFVAHNVNFDFPFLNYEFERVGYPTLSIKAVDTVTLSQILLPSVNGYRLRDLSRYFGIKHEHPHSADSDAFATAKLFIMLMKRLAELPLLTLKQLTALSGSLPRQTAELIQDAFERKQKNPGPLPDYLMIKENIVLRVQRTKINDATTEQLGHYPQSKKAKLALFQGDLGWRSAQSRIMNAIYANYKAADSKALVIEAPTGIGKTIAYLLPFAYLAIQNQLPVVISSTTTLLQSQLIEKAIPILSKILKVSMNATLVKGSNHYIDLAKFSQQLNERDPANQSRLIKMKLLVWLTYTKTGDLDELHINNHKIPLLNEIRHQGIASLDKNNPFYELDFYQRVIRKAHISQIVVTNHAFLSHHADLLGNKQHKPYLVIDEAQRFVNTVLQENRMTFDINHLMSMAHSEVSHLKMNEGINRSQIIQSDPMGSFHVYQMAEDLETINQLISNLQEQLFKRFLSHQMPVETNHLPFQHVITYAELQSFYETNQTTIKNLQSNFTSEILAFEALNRIINKQQQNLIESEVRTWIKLNNSQLEVETQTQIFLKIFGSFLNHASYDRDADFYWVQVGPQHDAGSVSLSQGVIESANYIKERVYPWFQKPTLIGATLFSNSRSKYFLNQVGLISDATTVKKYSSPYDFAENALLQVVNDGPMINEIGSEEYAQFLTTAIYQLAKVTPGKILVLFNSLTTIKDVFELVQKTDLGRKRRILAQGVNGTKSKLTREFLSSSTGILFGAASFWEGMDLSNGQLDLLIVTRLPFDSPDEIFTKAETKLQKQAHKNPFMTALLPRSILRLKQGIGRLIRSDSDYGAAVILDRRILDKSYGKTMLHSLPKGMPIQKLPLNQTNDELDKFFRKHY
ncbi:helicase C-terminal domain-containing protein [Pediococcus ethanolidurans]|uniref:helicase C-terminal domain-containing protein n=2 Tax=Pediococcus ethanolidurans TaxID=319653 RepID=UPI001C1EB33F|nr:helicase C-terminal domain-containing protein [Pediococcus ethanolidurans]MBU7555008.1 DEAD/DEAH box helicase [Pediococcus ethanolidurans]MCT4398947.1 DEAD/DEAH box helicase [Pediococcus ethanolidurans]MCV3314955.1 exonuclease domain-containing protein [Pediococcus ethanolidurans]MCV3321838.1 exonuclease domain-containing protein [Pediococcus ethanolidurans]MCV3323043.1 exonuclease domain-containing protein [Pediococcus ethanolidurans]